MKTQHDIQEFAKIVHLYYIDGIFDKKDVETWLGEIECDLDKVTKTKISFNFFCFATFTISSKSFIRGLFKVSI